MVSFIIYELKNYKFPFSVLVSNCNFFGSVIYGIDFVLVSSFRYIA
jgi:hypothetical protein